MDAYLVEDGTYWVAQRGDDGHITASGGWSLRAPGYAGRERAAAEAPVVPKIRSIFVDPDHARGGLGRAIMARAEADIAAHGFGRAGLVATLMGVPFYAALGYRAGRPVVLNLAPGVRFIGLAMERALPAAQRHAA
jgi:GNAT superfamily N-acetyltransferase